jgi:N-acyl-D-amino-acid deacylase
MRARGVDVHTALPLGEPRERRRCGSHNGGQDPTGLTHPRAYGNFPRVIARYVRDRRTLTLEAAIRKMTSWPATRMRLADRGAIRVGCWADAVVFEYDALQDRATYDQPVLSPTGIDYVLVNGHVVIDPDRHTGERPGHVLYGSGRTQR